MPAKPAAPLMAQPMQVLLSFVAGYVDGVTFLALFGLFVAQVTGSFVIAGAQLVTRDPGVIVKVLAMPVFLLAAVVTTLIVRGLGARRATVAWTIALEAVLVAGLFATLILDSPVAPDAAPGILASLLGLAAMGVQSASVRLLSGGGGSTNVMTTNTTQVAIDATEVALAWMKHRRRPQDETAAVQLAGSRRRLAALASLILGFLAGTVAGALAYAVAGASALLVPIAILLAVLLRAVWTP